MAYPGFQRGGCLRSGPIQKVGGGGGARLFHCIESVITLCARAPEKVILNLPSNGVGYIGVNRLCHGVTNLLNVKKSRYHEEQLNK